MSRLTLALALGAALACASDGTGPGGGGTNPEADQIAVRDNAYVPSERTITAGQSITWLWQSANRHSVTFDDPSFADSDVKATGRHTVRFDEAGTFTFYCSVHGRAVMSGRVVVERESGPMRP